MCVYVYLSAVAWGGQKGPWDPLELGLQAIVSGLTWAQGDKLYSSEFQRWMGAISPTPKAFFLMVETLWSILQTPYIFQNKTRGWDSQYILLFAFCFLFLVSPFADFIPGEFHPRMQWNMIISAPPHLSLQLPFSPSHHISLPTSYTLSKTFSADHMWMGVRQTPGAR